MDPVQGKSIITDPVPHIKKKKKLYILIIITKLINYFITVRSYNCYFKNIIGYFN